MAMQALLCRTQCTVLMLLMLLATLRTLLLVTSAACCVFAGGPTEAMLLQLGKLPRIKTQEGMASDVDTDKDVGSEATDLGDASDMDVY
jgi:hypothetical protein